MPRSRFSKQAQATGGVSATRETSTTNVNTGQPVMAQSDLVLNQQGQVVTAALSQEPNLVQQLIRGGNILTAGSEGSVSETSVTYDSNLVTLLNGQVGEDSTFTKLATNTGFLANLTNIINNNSTIGAAITILVPSNDAFGELGQNLLSTLSGGNFNETANKILAYHLILKSGNFLGEKYPRVIPINEVLIPPSLLEDNNPIAQIIGNNGESVETTVAEVTTPPTIQIQIQPEVPKWLRQQSQVNNWDRR